MSISVSGLSSSSIFGPGVGEGVRVRDLDRLDECLRFRRELFDLNQGCLED